MIQLRRFSPDLALKVYLLSLAGSVAIAVMDYVSRFVPTVTNSFLSFAADPPGLAHARTNGKHVLVEFHEGLRSL